MLGMTASVRVGMTIFESGFDPYTFTRSVPYRYEFDDLSIELGIIISRSETNNGIVSSKKDFRALAKRVSRAMLCSSFSQLNPLMCEVSNNCNI